jgi:hypothetical protein
LVHPKDAGFVWCFFFFSVFFLPKKKECQNHYLDCWLLGL